MTRANTIQKPQMRVGQRGRARRRPSGTWVSPSWTRCRCCGGRELRALGHWGSCTGDPNPLSPGTPMERKENVSIINFFWQWNQSKLYFEYVFPKYLVVQIHDSPSWALDSLPVAFPLELFWWPLPSMPQRTLLTLSFPLPQFQRGCQASLVGCSGTSLQWSKRELN